MTENRLRRPLGTFTKPTHHPSRGGNPYSIDFRTEVITRYQLGLPLVTPELEALRDLYAYPSIITCMRCIEKERALGHWQPKYATGNHFAERDILGQALVHLALYRVVHPEAPISNVRAFLFDMNPTIAPYSEYAVVKAEFRMKRSCTTRKRAYWRVNLHKRRMFWSRDYHFGRLNITTRDMIDMDQAGMK